MVPAIPIGYIDVSTIKNATIFKSGTALPFNNTNSELRKNSTGKSIGMYCLPFLKKIIMLNVYSQGYFKGSVALLLNTTKYSETTFNPVLFYVFP